MVLVAAKVPVSKHHGRPKHQTSSTKSQSEMRTCLVTGGAGFIGSHLVETLVRRGERVRVLDNFATGKIENLVAIADDIELISGDVRRLRTGGA